MIPSANSTGDLTSAWHTDSWADHAGAAAAAVATAYNSSSGAPAAADPSRYLTLHRHQILDWENAMLLASSTAHHSNASSDSVYDHVSAEYSKAAGISHMQADALASLSHPRQYEDLLSAQMASSASSASFTNNNAWGLLNTVCTRTSGNALQQEASLLQIAGTQYNSYESLNGADGLAGYGGLGTAAAASLYADSLRSSSSSSIGLTSFDQRRLDDIMKRELYTTHDLNSRLGLNLGGRTYFSADDFAFGRWGKRLRPNSPGCMMQPAPLCQAEGCKADLSMAKHYHRRHKVCEYHSKAATVHIGDQTQRFCQQCSRFHVLDEFDDGKRSCRKRLADHNRRRRKPQPTPASTAAETTTTEAAAGDASGDQQPNKEPSQEATTGSDSLQTGAQSSKGSPLPAAEDQPKIASTSTPGMTNHNEVSSSSKNSTEQENHQISEQSKATATSNKGLLNSSGNHGRMEMTISSPKTTSLAANLSLGGATDLLDVKPANPMIPASIIDAHDGSPFEDSLTTSKHTVVMPWLQGSKKHHNVQELPYEENTRNAADESGEHAQYARFKTSSSVGFKEGHTRGSWMVKDVAGAPAANTSDVLLLNTRYAGGSKSGSGEAGGHELLRLLGDERDMLSNNKHASLQENTGGSIGTLAFLDHSLDQSIFARSDQHRMLHFSNLQSPDAEQQAAMSLNRGLSPSLTFDNHNHMM